MLTHPRYLSSSPPPPLPAQSSVKLMFVLLDPALPPPSLPSQPLMPLKGQCREIFNLNFFMNRIPLMPMVAILSDSEALTRCRVMLKKLSHAQL